MMLKYIVNNVIKYETVKQLFKDEFLFSDKLITKIKNAKQIYVNNHIVNINHRLHVNDIVCADIDFEENCDNIVPTKMNLNILYEDEALLILDKPPYVPVHPSMDHYEDSLSNGVKFYFNSISLKRKIRPVNRLDKNTSGIVIFAKNEYIQECLIKQMKTNSFKKIYLAVVDGIIKEKEQIINAPIARKKDSIIERCVDESGDNAITIIRLIDTFDNYSLLECTLKTGRTHQIRVHASHICHPILGDDLYGKKSEKIDRQALHAYKIAFIHPITKEKIGIESKIPEDIKNLIDYKNDRF